MSTADLEKRLVALEAEVAALKKKASHTAELERPWWEEIAGTFANDPIYDEAMRLGRQYRDSLGPKEGRRRNGRARHRPS